MTLTELIQEIEMSLYEDLEPTFILSNLDDDLKEFYGTVLELVTQYKQLKMLGG